MGLLVIFAFLGEVMASAAHQKSMSQSTESLSYPKHQNIQIQDTKKIRFEVILGFDSRSLDY